jgi:hypothetical protein
MADKEFPGGTGVTDKSAADLESAGMKFVGTHPTVADAWETDYSDIRDAAMSNPGGAIGDGTAATGLYVDGPVIINEVGGDTDVRIEGDTDTDLLVVDAGNDKVGIGIAADSITTKLQIDGIIRITMDTTDVSDPPTTTELNSAIGAAGTVGDGTLALLDDNNGGTDVYLLTTDGSDWYYLQFLKCPAGA